MILQIPLTKQIKDLQIVFTKFQILHLLTKYYCIFSTIINLLFFDNYRTIIK